MQLVKPIPRFLPPEPFMRTKSENRACRDLCNNVRGPVAIFKLHQFIDNSKKLSTLLLLAANQNKK